MKSAIVTLNCTQDICLSQSYMKSVIVTYTQLYMRHPLASKLH